MDDTWNIRITTGVHFHIMLASIADSPDFKFWNTGHRVLRGHRSQILNALILVFQMSIFQEASHQNSLCFLFLQSNCHKQGQLYHGKPVWFTVFQGSVLVLLKYGTILCPDRPSWYKRTRYWNEEQTMATLSQP